MNNDEQSPFQRLTDIIARLRAPDGCPWDREQTHESIRSCLIEESYEVIDAINDDPSKLQEELGDVLMQVMLHSQIAKEDNRFNIDDVVNTLCEKLIIRHPHVFGDVKVNDTTEVLQNWEKNKRKEKSAPKKMLSGIPKGLPALQKAHRIGEKVARIGFDWDTPENIVTKIEEELSEFLECYKEEPNNTEHIEEELGDVLFSIAQLSRKLGMNCEEVLQRANDKFTRRFNRVEELTANGIENSNREELEKLWAVVKSEEKK